MFWRKRIPEIDFRYVGIGHKFFYEVEDHQLNPDLIDALHLIKLDTSKDTYFAYYIWDDNRILRYFRHSVGLYYCVDIHFNVYGGKMLKHSNVQENIKFSQIGDDWTYVFNKEYSMEEGTIVDEKTFDLVIADEVELLKRQEEWKKVNGKNWEGVL